MFRKDLIELLLDHPMSVSELARELRLKPRDVADDLRHLFRSLKHERYRPEVRPAECLKCGFVFHKDKLLKPGKCPRCRGTWIDEPLVTIRE